MVDWEREQRKLYGRTGSAVATKRRSAPEAMQRNFPLPSLQKTAVKAKEILKAFHNLFGLILNLK